MTFKALNARGRGPLPTVYSYFLLPRNQLLVQQWINAVEFEEVQYPVEIGREFFDEFKPRQIVVFCRCGRERLQQPLLQERFKAMLGERHPVHGLLCLGGKIGRLYSDESVRLLFAFFSCGLYECGEYRLFDNR